MSFPTTILAALFVSGLAGSLGHCLGMCGPLVLMLGAQFPKRTWDAMAPRYLLYHAARILVYALLGLIAGSLASVIGLGGSLSRLAGLISLALGLGVILFGMRYLGWLPFLHFQEGSGWLTKAMSKTMQRGGIFGLVALGALNGLLPCGLVYSALLAAGSTGHPLVGAAGMALFGLGTVPALLILGIGAGRLSIHTRQVMMRVAGLLIIVVGVQLVLRGGAGLGMLNHIKVFGIMLW